MSIPIEDRVRLALDEEVASCDAALLSRLNRARQQALDQGLSGRRRAVHSPWLGWAAAASLLLAVLLAPWPPAGGPAPTVNTAAAVGEDLDLLLAADEIEVIEDLEFYAWLQQQSLDG
jgi:hypothetical protein